MLALVRLLTPEALILKTLEEKPRRANELLERTKLAKSVLYRAIKDLMMNGWVRKREVDREVVYEITSEGRRALEEARRVLATS